MPDPAAAADFESRRFQTAAAHYLSGRPPYPEGLIVRTVQLAGLGKSDRLLDLGCGPAQLATAFAPYVGEAVAMDPEPKMLALARQAARGLPNVQVVEGRSDDLGPAHGRFKAVVIGRAFHWMDRAETLKTLDTLIEPDGAVVLFGEEHPKIPENARIGELQQLIRDYALGDATHTMAQVRELPHASVLLASPFHRLEQVSVYARHRLTLQTLIDRVLSFSSTSRARLGDKADELVADLTRKFAEWEQAGPMEEVLASRALMAWRG